MKEQEEIVAYRVGDHFLCPKHYQLSVRILAVHGIELPAQPVKDGEIQSFVCDQCEPIDKPVNGGEEKKVVYLQESINSFGLLEKVDENIKRFMEIQKDQNTMIEMIAYVSKINRRGKFIQKTFGLAHEGRPLSRKNIATLQKFLDDLRETLNALRSMAIYNVLVNIDYRRLLAEEGRRKFCALTPEEQKVLRTKFTTIEKYSQGQEHIVKEAVAS